MLDTKRVRATWLLILFVSVAVSACGGSPNSPSDRYPDVSGYWTGTLTDYYGSQIYGTYSLEASVSQSGSQVTIQPAVNGISTPAITGTISETGFFRKTGGGTPDGDRSDGCGYYTETGMTIAFSGNTAEYNETETSDCATRTLKGSLVRR